MGFEFEFYLSAMATSFECPFSLLVRVLYIILWKRGLHRHLVVGILYLPLYGVVESKSEWCFHAAS